MNVSAIFQDNALLVTFDGNTHSIDDSHPNYDEIFEHLKSQNYEAAKSLCEMTYEIINWGDDELTVQGGEMIFKGKPLGNAFVRRIKQMMDDNQNREPLKVFLASLFRNPSNRSIEQVPEFVYSCDLPITEDGYILGYKLVNDDFTDCWTGKIDNSPGQIVKEDRRLISDDPSRTCDRGLHVCSWYYISPTGAAAYSGNRLILVKVKPENIVCVPTDHHRTKIRVCEYEVIEEITGEDKDDPTKVYERETVWSAKPESEDGDEDYDPSDEDYDEDYAYDEDYDEDYEPDLDSYEDENEDEGTDVESDAEQRHVFHNVRDEKGRFTKNEDSKVEKVQPRDSKGRFMSKMKNFIGGSK